MDCGTVKSNGLIAFLAGVVSIAIPCLAHGQIALFPLGPPVAGANAGVAGLDDAVSAGDLNHDGYTDIIAGLAPTLAWVLGGPGASFSAPTVLSLASPSIGTALSNVADTDGDGNADVVLSNASYVAPFSQLRVLVGDGSGQLSLAPLFPFPPAWQGHVPWCIDVIPGGPPEIVVLSGPIFPTASGNAVVSLPLPNLPSLQGARVFVQWAVAAPGSTLGYGLSQGRQIIFW